MDDWNDLNKTINFLKQERRFTNKEKFKKCKFCNDNISRKNLSKHLFKMHLKDISLKKKKYELISKIFIKNTNRIIGNLEEIQGLLTETLKMKIKKTKHLKKTKWFNEYQNSINDLINILKGKGSEDDEEESDNEDN